MSFIGIIITGGLGNQLFEVFCALSYAIDNNLQLKIFSKDKYGVPNDYWDRNTYWHSLLDRLKQYVHPVIASNDLPVYEEKSFAYDAIPNALSNHLLKGYYQSYKYFEHNYDKIKEIIDLDNKRLSVRNKYAHLLSEKKVIAVHFRFEDCIIRSQYHELQQPSYYIKALNAISNDLSGRNESIEDYKILYFYARYENDEELVLKYVQEIKTACQINVNFVPIPANIEDWEEMLLMSCCDHLIIANSSFSWFAAYFCDKPDKLVYYPSVWFGPKLAHYDVKDLCPLEWIREK